MNITEKQKAIIEVFKDLPDWDEKYAYIIKLGKELASFPDEHKKDSFKIEGCQSQVWLKAEFRDGKVEFLADSDAMIVKGLIAILVKVYSGETPESILSTPPDFLKAIGIENHLSPTRKNGLGSMLKQIQLYAVAFKAMQSGK